MQAGVGGFWMTVVSSVPRPANDAAFNRYVLPEMEVLLRVAISITRNPTDAEDLVQETLIRAYKAVDRFDGRYPRAWLLTIMRNAQINRVRRKRPELLRDPDDSERLIELGSPSESPEDLVVDQVFDSAVESAFDRLPDKFRQVITLVDLDGLSYQEAADVMGVPIGTIMSRLHRARRRIRDRLSAAGLAPRSAR